MVSVVGYGCSSAGGQDAESFFRSLIDGIDCSRSISEFSDISSWPVVPDQELRLCRFQHSEIQSVQNLLIAHLEKAYRECILRLGRPLSNFGVILSSTKGILDDFIWSAADEKRHNSETSELLKRDPITPLLEAFLKKVGLKPLRSICVSNACTSSHSALFLAKEWIEGSAVDEVLVIAAEAVGPFTVNGFASLQALTPDRVRPFGKDRRGLQLGEAAAAMIVSHERSGAKDIPIGLSDISIYSEGFAVTRSAPSGRGLSEAIANLFGLDQSPPDLIVAHATGTEINDKVEDAAFSHSFRDCPPITSIKWSVGHTLGVSGLMDTIAACEILKNRKVFSMANTLDIDPELRGNYLTSSTATSHLRPKNILVTSVGFGGVHGALLLEVQN